VFNLWRKLQFQCDGRRLFEAHQNYRNFHSAVPIGKWKNRNEFADNLNPRISDRTGHPMAVSTEMEEVLFMRLLSVKWWELGLSPNQMRWAEVHFAEENWLNIESKVAGIDRLRALLRWHFSLSLRKPEFWKTEKKEEGHYFRNLKDIMKECHLLGKLQFTYNVWTSYQKWTRRNSDCKE
jgi:hypothetical protein